MFLFDYQLSTIKKLIKHEEEKFKLRSLALTGLLISAPVIASDMNNEIMISPIIKTRSLLH